MDNKPADSVDDFPTEPAPQLLESEFADAPQAAAPQAAAPQAAAPQAAAPQAAAPQAAAPQAAAPQAAAPQAVAPQADGAAAPQANETEVYPDDDDDAFSGKNMAGGNDSDSDSDLPLPQWEQILSKFFMHDNQSITAILSKIASSLEKLLVEPEPEPSSSE
jgi:hypothetical protein